MVGRPEVGQKRFSEMGHALSSSVYQQRGSTPSFVAQYNFDSLDSN
jgi:hypothetical protein